MHLPWTNGLRGLLVICLMSGLVACGSLASCFNSGFAPVACGGGYGESHVASLPQPTATSVEGRWTGMIPTGRTVVGLVLEDGSYWLFYTARDNPTVLAGLIQGTGTSHSGAFGSSNTRDFNAVIVTVDVAGTLSGYSSDGCTVAGTLSPRATGNEFQTSATFGGGACRQGTETVTGLVLYNATTHRLFSAALNRSRTTSFLFLGTKR
jgi:hypothetical protein